MYRLTGAVLKGTASILISGFFLMASAQSTWEVDGDFFAFGTLSRETLAEHTFYFRNTGVEPLRIRSVHMTTPLKITKKLTNPVPPGERIPITVGFGMPPEIGRFAGEVLISFEDPDMERLRLRLTAEIVNPIQFEPFQAFFVTAARGKTSESAVDIINHEDEPLQIMRVDNPSSRFTTRLETIEEGKHYRLHLTLPGAGTAGKMVDTITLVTTSSRHPFLEVQANTYIRERVYSFPDLLEFGTISVAELKARPDLLSFLPQTVMVYQEGGKDFEIQVGTDVPFLRLSSTRSKFGDRYQIELAIIPEKLRAGPVAGSILITTNDPEFPQLTVPVKAMVQGSW